MKKRNEGVEETQQPIVSDMSTNHASRSVLSVIDKNNSCSFRRPHILVSVVECACEHETYTLRKLITTDINKAQGYLP